MSNGRPWTPAEDAHLRRLVTAGMGDLEIGRDMDRHPKFIGQKRRGLNLDRGPSRLYLAAVARWNLRRTMRRLARV